jgi:hypothetical protein
MRFFTKIQLIPFMVSFFIGFFVVYILKPTPVVIYKNPNLDNAGKVTYVDRNYVCFQYIVKKVDCDKNEERISIYPLQ